MIFLYYGTINRLILFMINFTSAYLIFFISENPRWKKNREEKRIDESTKLKIAFFKKYFLLMIYLSFKRVRSQITSSSTVSGLLECSVIGLKGWPFQSFYYCLVEVQVGQHWTS